MKPGSKLEINKSPLQQRLLQQCSHAVKHLSLILLENSHVLQETRIVTQFHFVNWPDHGVPANTSSMVYLRNMVNQQHSDNSLGGPIIVHCR